VIIGGTVVGERYHSLHTLHALSQSGLSRLWRSLMPRLWLFSLCYTWPLYTKWYGL